MVHREIPFEKDVRMLVISLMGVNSFWSNVALGCSGLKARGGIPYSDGEALSQRGAILKLQVYY